MQTKLINLLIILQCVSFLCVTNAQNGNNLERKLQRFIQANNLYETYPFDSNLEVGDICIVSTTQREGVCKRIEDCHSVAEKFVNTRQLDDICRFSRRSGRISVCCPRKMRPQGGNQNQPQINPAVPAPPPTTAAPVTAVPVTVAPVTVAPVTVAPVTVAPAIVAPNAGVNTLRKSYISKLKDNF
jgi:hypothetical protein